MESKSGGKQRNSIQFFSLKGKSCCKCPGILFEFACVKCSMDHANGENHPSMSNCTIFTFWKMTFSSNKFSIKCLAEYSNIFRQYDIPRFSWKIQCTIPQSELCCWAQIKWPSNKPKSVIYQHPVIWYCNHRHQRACVFVGNLLLFSMTSHSTCFILKLRMFPHSISVVHKTSRHLIVLTSWQTSNIRIICVKRRRRSFRQENRFQEPVLLTVIE